MTYLTREQTDKVARQLSKAIDEGVGIFDSCIDYVEFYEEVFSESQDAGFIITLEDGTKINVTVQALK